MSDFPETPCYVISSNGFKDAVSFVDETDFGRFVGDATGGVQARDLIKADIRRHTDRNGVALFFVSDHGNVSRVRRVTLRTLTTQGVK